jgi:hypothetical protein
MTAAPPVVAEKPWRAIECVRSGTTTMAPTLAPVSAIAIARPWYLSNHGATVALRPITDIVA